MLFSNEREALGGRVRLPSGNLPSDLQTMALSILTHPEHPGRCGKKTSPKEVGTIHPLGLVQRAGFAWLTSLLT